MQSIILYIIIFLGTIESIYNNRFVLLGGKTTGRLFQNSLISEAKEKSLSPLLFSISGELISMAYDTRNRIVFFSNYDGVTFNLNKIGLSNSYIGTKYALRFGADGLALDPAEKLIFYSSRNLNSIMVRDYDGRTDLTIVSNVAVAGSMDIHRKLRRLYFMDIIKGVIETCNYDGTDRKIIYKSELTTFLDSASLQIQHNTGMIFSTFDSQRIFKIDTGGKNFQVVYDFKKTLMYEYLNNTNLDYYFSSFSLDENNIYLLGKLNLKSLYDNTNSYLTIVGQEIDKNGRSKHYEEQKFNQSFVFTSIYENDTGTGPEVRSLCTGESHGCSDLCLPKVKGYVCACNETYRLETDKRTCKKVLSKNGPLLMMISSEKNAGTLIGIQGNPRDYIFRRKFTHWYLNSQGFTWNAFDINYEDSEVILFDSNDRCLSIVSLNGTEKIQTFGHTASSRVFGVAYDWINKNIYWTDAQMNWIRMCNHRGLYETTIVEQNLEEPHGIAVHPIKRLLFWSDRGERSIIMQSDLTGSQVKVITDKNLDTPKGLAIDYHNDILYWNCKHNLMSYNLKSSSIKTFDFDTTNTFEDITIFMHFVIVSGRRGNGSDFRVFFRDMRSVDNELVSLSSGGRFTSVKMYDETRQTLAKSACKKNRCPQLCVPGFSEKDTKCLCSDGYSTRNSSSGEVISCEKVIYSDETPTGVENDLIVFTSEKKRCQIGISQVLDEKNVAEMCSTTGGRNVFRSLAYNYEGKSYFYTITSFIYRSRIPLTRIFSMGVSRNKKNANRLIYSHTGYITGLVYDWVAGALYCSDSSQGTIWAIKGGFRKTLLTGRSNVFALELDLKRRKLFWSESSGNMSYVMTSDLNGQNIDIYYKQKTEKINATITSLSFDYAKNRLYWIDGVNGNIISSNTNRKNDKQILLKAGPGVYGLAAIKDFIAFTKNATSGMLTVIDQDQKEVRSGNFGIGGAMARDIVAFSKSNQPDLPDEACWKLNGGCEQFCFNSPKSSFACSCVYGQSLTKEKRNCAPNNLMTEGSFVLFAGFHSGQVYQTDENIIKSTRSFSALKLPKYHKPVSLAYDYHNKIVFWSDAKSDTTYYMDIDGSRFRKRNDYRLELELDGEGKAKHNHLIFSKMHYDVNSGLLYALYNGISVSNREGTMYRQLISSEFDDFKIDPPNGYIYTLNNGLNSTITRYDMDGNKGTLLVRGRSIGVNFAIDFNSGRIYWLENMSSSIFSCDSNGRGVTEVTKTGFYAAYALVEVHGANLIVNTPFSQTEHLVYYNGKSVSTVDLEVDVNAYDILYVDKDQETRGKTACGGNNGNCSHFCIPLPGNNRACVCPVQWDGNRNITNSCTSSEICKTKGLTNGDFALACHGREGASCDFTCKSVYRKRVQRLTCWNGKWSIEPSTACIQRTCPTMQAPANSHLNLGCPIIAEVGTTCWTRCDDGALLKSGDEHHVCLTNGEWSGTPVQCTRNDCMNNFENGHFLAKVAGQTTTIKGASIGYECFKDYKATDSKEYTCLADGQWNTNTNLLCRRKRCNESEQLPNAISTCTYRDELGSSCNYQCKFGMIYVGGSVQRFCQVNRTWDGQPIICQGKSTNKFLSLGEISGISSAASLLIMIIIFVTCYLLRRNRNFATVQRKPVLGNVIYKLTTKMRGRIHRNRVNEGAGEAMSPDLYRSSSYGESQYIAPGRQAVVNNNLNNQSATLF